MRVRLAWPVQHRRVSEGLEGRAAEIMIGGVLVHVWSTFTDPEVDFWKRVDRALKARGSGLALTGSHRPARDLGVPFYYVPYRYFSAGSLSEIAAAVRSAGPGTPRAFLERLGLDVELLALREEQWTGRRISDDVRMEWEVAFAFYAAVYASLLDRLKPRLVVIWNGYHPGEIVLHDLAVRSGCATSFVERGPFARTLYFDPAGILARSSIVQQSSVELPDPEKGDGEAAFTLLREMLARGGLTWWTQAEASGPAALRSSLSIPEEHSVVLFAEQLEADTQSFEFSPSFRSPAEAFSWLNRCLEGKPNIYLLGKSHPFSDKPVEEWERLRRVPGAWRRDINLFDAMACATHVAAVNSTVLYEAMIAGKPTLSMGEGLFTGRQFFYEVRSPADADTVGEWLAGAGLPERVHRFEQFCGFLLRRGVYAYGFPDEQGYRGLRAEDLADRLADYEGSGTPAESPGADEEAIDWILRLATEWTLREDQLRAESARAIAEFGRAGALVRRLRGTRAWAAARAAWTRVASPAR